MACRSWLVPYDIFGYFHNSLVPATQFMDLTASSIYPELSGDKAQAALQRKEHTPMQYGLRLHYENQPIQSITIKYKYLGFKKMKNITRWFIANFS